MRIVWGLVMIGIAFAIIIYRRSIHNFTGNISFFDKYVGNTQNGYTLVAIVIIIIAMMYMTGTIDSFMGGEIGGQIT